MQVDLFLLKQINRWELFKLRIRDKWRQFKKAHHLLGLFTVLALCSILVVPALASEAFTVDGTTGTATAQEGTTTVTARSGTGTVTVDMQKGEIVFNRATIDFLSSNVTYFNFNWNTSLNKTETSNPVVAFGTGIGSASGDTLKFNFVNGRGCYKNSASISVTTWLLPVTWESRTYSWTYYNGSVGYPRSATVYAPKPVLDGAKQLKIEGTDNYTTATRTFPYNTSNYNESILTLDSDNTIAVRGRQFWYRSSSVTENYNYTNFDGYTVSEEQPADTVVSNTSNHFCTVANSYYFSSGIATLYSKGTSSIRGYTISSVAGFVLNTSFRPTMNKYPIIVEGAKKVQVPVSWTNAYLDSDLDDDDNIRDACRFYYQNQTLGNILLPQSYVYTPKTVQVPVCERVSSMKGVSI